MRKLFISISLTLLTALFSVAMAQEVTFPNNAGSKVKYSALIEMPKGYISGICILCNDGGLVRGAIFNEFGISAIDFVYDTAKEKVKLGDVIKLMDRWRIRRVLKKDLARLMKNLSQGVGTYRNERYKINYRLKQLNDATEE